MELTWLFTAYSLLFVSVLSRFYAVLPVGADFPGPNNSADASIRPLDEWLWELLKRDQE